jgi:hypothetical protein
LQLTFGAKMRLVPRRPAIVDEHQLARLSAYAAKRRQCRRDQFAPESA